MGDKPQKPDQGKESTNHKPPPVTSKKEELIIGKKDFPLSPKQKPPTDNDED
ncbi:MAG: hypothetical protein AB1847_17455 [bacterium]